MRKTLAELSSVLGLSVPSEWRRIEITGVAEDSRSVRPGELFVAIRGFVDDGHRYVEEALARGAAAVVAERELHCDAPCIRVKDTREALARLSAAFYDHPTRGLYTIGVTGTNGKTTVCHLAAQLLGPSGTVLITTVANETRGLHAVTTPSSPIVQRIAHEALAGGKRHLVIEASSVALSLHRVLQVDFDVAVFTNLTHDHLDFHVDRARYLESKLRLFRGLKEQAWAVVNADDPLYDRFQAVTAAQGLTYAIDRRADVHAADLRTDPTGTAFTLRVGKQRAIVRVGLPAEHNVSNLLAAVGVAVAHGIPFRTVVERLESARGVAGRYQLFTAPQRPAVVVDFAHSPDALERMLHSLKTFYKRIICVFGCTGEADRAKRPLMGELSGRLAEVTILTTDNPKTENPEAILDEIERGIRPTGGRYERLVDRREAIRRALDLAGPEDVVLLAGKGHEAYQIVGDKRVPFWEADVLREEGYGVKGDGPS